MSVTYTSSSFIQPLEFLPVNQTFRGNADKCCSFLKILFYLDFNVIPFFFTLRVS